MATTATSAEGEVMAAIGAALDVAAITTTLGCAVHDDVPQAPTYPYIRFESPTGVPWDTFGQAGKERMVWVHVFSTYAGGLEYRAIVAKVIQLLQDVALSVSGHALARLRYEEDVNGADEDNGGVKVKHKIVMFRMNVLES